mgnify:CR=1 FL=1
MPVCGVFSLFLGAARAEEEALEPFEKCQD